LLSPELIFTNHLGQVLGKADDLAAHRSGLLRIEELRPSEQQVRASAWKCRHRVGADADRGKLRRARGERGFSLYKGLEPFRARDR
jgi:hypothetical protein